jgi:hypothetical protein
MAPDPSSNHAFMIRLYGSDDGDLRGHITHITHGQRTKPYPLKEVGDVLAFMEPYVRAMDVRLHLRSQLLLLLSRRRGRIPIEDITITNQSDAADG